MAKAIQSVSNADEVEPMCSHLNEECGVFGIYNSPDAASLTYYGLHALQHRGQEGAGIAASNGSKIRVKKAKGLVSEVFNAQERLDKLVGTMAIGHTRYSTAGNNWSSNLQPFVFHLHDHNIALAHNGNLINATTLKVQLEKQGSIFFSNSDSEVLMHLIMRAPGEHFRSKLKHSLLQVKGGFSYLLMTDTKLYGAVDPLGLRPLVIGRLKTGDGYVLASETCALDIIGATFERDLRGGELVEIDEDGMHIERYAPEQPTCVAAMEYVYFSRPDSNILGKNVHAVRKRCGARLAQDFPVEADMVIGVPNSSLSAASGFAEATGLPYELGLIKNQYVSRTFIQPTQVLREKGVRMKLSPVKGIVEGKSIVLVDDSIVRGTTSRRIVRMLKDVGAREVHVRIASPQMRFPSFYGIDISTTEELISANKTLPELREFLGADSLEFLSPEGLVDSVGLDLPGEYRGLCMDSFTGHYPAGLGDYEQRYHATMTDIQKEFLASTGQKSSS